MVRAPYLSEKLISEDSMLLPPRLTAAQKAVLQVLQQQSQPVSAQSLYRLIRTAQPISLATVYRALDALNCLGMVWHRTTQAGETLYSTQPHHPPYITCLECGESLPLEILPFEEHGAHLQRQGTFKIYYHTLEFFGRCGRCKAQRV